MENLKKPWQNQNRDRPCPEDKPCSEVKSPKEASTTVSPQYRDYKDNLAKLKKLFGYGGDFNRFYGPRGVEMIKKAHAICERDLNKLMSTDSVTCSGSDTTTVKRAIDLLVDVILSNRITPFIQDMSLYMGRLVFNWDTNVSKARDIRRLSVIAQRLATGHMSILESIDIQRKLLEMLKKEMRNRPPAYELSKHLLRTLDE